MSRPNFPPSPLLLVLVVLATPTMGNQPEATGDAAAGYVADATCARCHRSYYESFQHVGMSQSFKQPQNARALERFGETFFHRPSQRYYEIHRRDSSLTFRRYQRDNEGRVINEVEIPVDWVLGSGNRTRSYIYRNGHGELFQLPIGWYSEGEHWEMSPGFEARDHDGLGRKLTRECMFCHNAYPESDLDDYADPDLFSADLPEGIGCQRCHGPGGKHVAAAAEDIDLETIRGAIVNPGKLTGAVQDSVCMQCHLLPAIAVTGPRRFGRGDYSFRPGELLTDYMVHLDVRERGVPEPERFEINHHGYRMLKSACYQESDGALGCISCHDPHVKPDSTTFRQQVAGVCRDCHGAAAHTGAEPRDGCVACHMPTRRTRDVIHVTMTDHWISRGPFDQDALVAPVDAETRPISEVKVLDFGDPPDGLDAQAYVALGAMRAGRSLGSAAESLLRVLQQKNYEHYAPYLDFVRAQVQLGRMRSAEAGARGLIGGDPNLPAASALLGVAHSGQDDFHGAISAFRKSLDAHPDPETYFNLAVAYVNTGQLALAQQQLEAALSLRPTLAAAYRLMGQIHHARDDAAKARESLEEALRLDPGDTATYQLLVPLLRAMGNNAGADRYLELGRRSARQPELL